MKLLVTGGTGFIGSNLALALEQEGHDVTVLDWKTDRAKENLTGFPGTIVEGDIADTSMWGSLPTDFDAVLHQAACADTTVTDEDYMMKYNRDAFELLLAWAKKNNIDVIYASSAATYGNAPSPQSVGKDEGPLNVYGQSKLAMDEIARKEFLNCSIKIIGLRYFNVYGPREAHKEKMASMIYQLAQQMKAGKNPRIFFDGEQSRDQIYVGDVVLANIRSLECDQSASGIYNVGAGHSVSFNEIVRQLNRVLGKDLEPEYFENPYDFYQNHTQSDISQTEDILGFHPSYSIETGITEYANSGLL